MQQTMLRIRELATRPASWTVASGWLLRILTAAAQFYAVRILTQSLGISGYAGFAILTGLLGWFMLADFGFGSSLQNYISQKRVEGGDTVGSIASVFVLLLISTILLSILWYAIAPWAGATLLGNITGLNPDAAKTSFFLYAAFSTGAGASAIALKIMFAEHRGYLAHLLSATTVYVGVGALALCHALKVSIDLPTAVILYGAPAWFIPTLYLAWYITRIQKSARWIGRFDFAPIIRLWPRARIFLLYTTFAALVLNVDYLVLSQTASADQIAVYAVYTRIYALGFFIFSSVLSAYWPLLAEMLHRADSSAVRPMLHNCILFGGAVMIAGALFLYLFGQAVADILSPSQHLILPVYLIPFFTAYWLVRIWTDSYAMLLHSANRTMVLCIVAPVQAILNLGLGYLGVTNFGIAGLLAGMTASFVLTTGWILPVYVKRRVLSVGGVIKQ